MARKNEIDCLNNVLRILKTSNQSKNKTVLAKVISILEDARENKDSNAFPDFISSCGLVEHFIVSASKETRKGSEYKIHETNEKLAISNLIKKKDAAFLSSASSPGTMETICVQSEFNETSYGCFVSSFKRNVDNHLKSLLRVGNSKGVVVFLIEQQDGRLSIYKNDSFYKFYLLAKDKILLNYLKEIRGLVHYVVFNSADTVEIIDLSQIDSLLLNADENQDIRGGRKIDLTTKIYIDL